MGFLASTSTWRPEGKNLLSKRTLPCCNRWPAGVVALPSSCSAVAVSSDILYTCSVSHAALQLSTRPTHIHTIHIRHKQQIRYLKHVADPTSHSPPLTQHLPVCCIPSSTVIICNSSALSACNMQGIIS